MADAAAACGVSERTVWRWIKAGHRAEPVAHGWQITTRAHALYVQWRGNVAAVHRELVAEGASPPSMRPMQRAFARDMAPAEQAYVRRGDAGRQEHAVHLRHEARYRAECYEGDQTAVVRQFACLHDPTGGVLVIRPTPGRGEGGIARDILRSLGKRFDIPRTPRAAPQLHESARIWC